MRCVIETGNYLTEVTANTFEDAVKKALLNASQMVIFGKLIAIRCDGQEERYTPTSSFLQELEQEHRAFYEEKANEEKIDDLVSGGLKGGFLQAQWAAKALGTIGKKAIPRLIFQLDRCAFEARVATGQQLYPDAPQFSAYLDYIDSKASLNYLESETTLDYIESKAAQIDKEIRRRLKRDWPNPCANVAQALVWIGKDSVEALLEYLDEGEHKDWIAREAVIWALAKIGDERAIPYLKDFIKLKFLRRDYLATTIRDAIRKSRSN